MPQSLLSYSLCISCFNTCDDFWYICYYECNKFFIHDTLYGTLALIICILCDYYEIYAILSDFYSGDMHTHYIWIIVEMVDYLHQINNKSSYLTLDIMLMAID